MVTHYVYTAWDGNGRPLYVGCTKNLAQRMADHMLRRFWMPAAALIDWQTYPDKATARAVEVSLIEELEPKFNRQHNPAWPAARDSGAWDTAS